MPYNAQSTQISLSLKFDGNLKHKDYAHVDKKIVHSHQKRCSVLTKRLLTHVFSQIPREATELAPFYQVKISELGKLGTAKIYNKDVKKSFQEMLNISWLIETNVNNNYRLIGKHLLNTTTHINCEYRNGVITLVLNPTLAPFLLQLSNYTNYQVKWYMDFSSWYSTRIYEILSSYKDTGWWYVELDEFRGLMGCTDKYKQDRDMIRKTLAEPLVELKETDCEFTVEKILGDKISGEKGRRSVVALKFILKNIKSKSIPQAWKDKSLEHQKVITEMTKVWKIDEVNFINYIAFLGLDGAKKLISEWKAKEHSNRRIDNKKLYCNASFVREASKQMELKAESKRIKDINGQLNIEDVIADVKSKLKED